MITEAGGFPIDRPAGMQLPVIVGEKGTLLVHAARCRARPGHASQPFRTDNALVKAAEVVRRLAEYQPETQIHDMWRRFVEGMDCPEEMAAPLLDPIALVGAARRAAARHGPAVPRVHAHHVRPDGRPRRAPRPT